MQLNIKEVKVGKRHRRDLGDIASLARSIEEVGLLHPIVVQSGGKLIAGERRVAAFRLLKRKTIPVTRINLESIVRGEAAENFERKNFTLSEAVAIRREIEPAIKAAARERRGRPKKGGNLPPFGKARDKIAALTGIKPRTLDKAAAIVAAAEAHPKKYGKLLEDMDRTGRADGPFKRLKVAKQAEIIRKESPGLPSQGPYRVIVADPPWPYELRKADPSHRATHPYPQMSVEQICKIDVGSLAHDDCVLWLWITNHHLIRCAASVLDAWGFQEKTILTWAKDRMGTGDWLRGQTEHCIMAVRGTPTVVLTNQTTLLRGPLRKNSQKPEEFYTFVESLCPAPRYAELFSRHKRPNWDGHGDEHA